MWIVHIFLMTEPRNIYLQNCQRLSTLIKAAAWLFLDTLRLLKIIHLSTSWMYSITSPFELDSSILPPGTKFKKKLWKQYFYQLKWFCCQNSTIQTRTVEVACLQLLSKHQMFQGSWIHMIRWSSWSIHWDLQLPCLPVDCTHGLIFINKNICTYFHAIIVYKLSAPMSSSPLL